METNMVKDITHAVTRYRAEARRRRAEFIEDEFFTLAATNERLAEYIEKRNMTSKFKLNGLTSWVRCKGNG